MIGERNVAAQPFKIEKHLLSGQNAGQIFPTGSTCQRPDMFQIVEDQQEGQDKKYEHKQRQSQGKVADADAPEFFRHFVCPVVQ